MPKTLFERMREAQSMTDDPKLQIARAICAKVRPDYADGFLSGDFDDSSTEIRTALAAIEECTERAVKLAADFSTTNPSCVDAAWHVSQALGRGDHLKGPPQ